MDEALRHYYLDTMGIRLWRQRDAAATEQEAMAVEPVPAPSTPPAEGFASLREAISRPPAPAPKVADIPLDWEGLRKQVAACEACPDLVANRSQTVFGVGDSAARLLVIGEAPGAEEERQGEPFVGRAGQLLNAMLQAIGFRRDQVYIANILKCRPPNNRDPSPEEATNCRRFLDRQIELIAPTLILVVGRIAAQNLLHTDQAIGKLRGQVWRRDNGEPPVVVTYHPAYLLRSPQEKRKAWDDLRLALRTFNELEGATQ